MQFLLAVFTLFVMIATASLLHRCFPYFRTNQPLEFIYLDPLRGILASSVFIFHTALIIDSLYFSGHDEFFIRGISFLGPGAVMVFFMITAFLFWLRVLRRKEHMNWKQYFIGRIKRIFPLYYFIFFVFITIIMFESHFNLNIPRTVFLKQIGDYLSFFMFHPLGDFNKIDQSMYLISQSWTLAWEWKFYFCLPLLAFLNRKYLLIPAMILLYIHLIHHQEKQTIELVTCFGVGMLIAYLYHINSKILIFLRKTKLTPFILIIALLSVLLYVPPDDPLQRMITIPSLGLIFAICISTHPFLDKLKTW